MVSSGAIRPARAPASIDMLQTVMRPAIDRPRITLAGILDHVAGAAGGADLADDREDHVLGGAAERQLAVDADPHVLRPLLQQRLGRQHVLDLGGADAEGERAEGAVRRGVAVAADDGHAGQGEALLGADDVDDALADVVDVEQRDAELAAVLLQGLDLDARALVGDAACERSVVGTLWSGTASVASGRRTLRPVRRRPSKACGLVTSWTRWRSM